MRSTALNLMMTSAAALILSLSAASAQDATKPASETAPAATGTTDSTMAQPMAKTDVVALPDWHPDITPDNAMSVENLLDMNVYGPTGEEIGDVENVLFGMDGEVLSVIAEVGGVWDIGDTHVNVPWDKVDIDKSSEHVMIPVTQETVEDYTLFTNDVITAADASTGIQEVKGDGPGLTNTAPRVWQARELIDDYVRLRDGDAFVNYGYVDDLIIKDGKVSAVVVRPDATYGARGLYAYPYYGYGYGWTPGLAAYDLPYTTADIKDMKPMDEKAWNSDS